MNGGIDQYLSSSPMNDDLKDKVQKTLITDTARLPLRRQVVLEAIRLYPFAELLLRTKTRHNSPPSS